MVQLLSVNVVALKYYRRHSFAVLVAWMVGGLVGWFVVWLAWPGCWFIVGGFLIAHLFVVIVVLLLAVYIVSGCLILFFFSVLLFF